MRYTYRYPLILETIDLGSKIEGFVERLHMALFMEMSEEIRELTTIANEGFTLKGRLFFRFLQVITIQRKNLLFEPLIRLVWAEIYSTDSINK